MRISGAPDSGWIPVDLGTVARAIAAARAGVVRPHVPDPRRPSRPVTRAG